MCDFINSLANKYQSNLIIQSLQLHLNSVVGAKDSFSYTSNLAHYLVSFYIVKLHLECFYFMIIIYSSEQCGIIKASCNPAIATTLSFERGHSYRQSPDYGFRGTKN